MWPQTGSLARDRAVTTHIACRPDCFRAGGRQRHSRATRVGCIPSRLARGHGTAPGRSDTPRSAAPSPKIGAAAEEVPGSATPPANPETPPYRGELVGDRRVNFRRPSVSLLVSRPASPPSVDPSTSGDETDGGEAAAPRAE